MEQKSYPKTAYFRVWADGALAHNRALKNLAETLINPKNGGYTISTYPPPQPIGLYNKNDLYIIAWKYFEFPPKKISDRTYLWQMETPFSITMAPPEKYKKHFNKIFTYYKPATDGKKVIYVPIPYNMDMVGIK